MRICVCVLALFLSACGSSQYEPRAWRERSAAKESKELFISAENLSFSFEEVLERSFTHSRDLLFSRQERAIAEEMRRKSRLAILPTLSLGQEFSLRTENSASYSQSSAGTVSSSWSFSRDRKKRANSISSLWSLLDFGLSFHQYRLEEKNADILHHKEQRLHQNFILDITKAYWELLSLQKGRGLLMDAQAQWSKHIKRLDTLLNSGLIEEAEVLQSRDQAMALKEHLLDYQEQWAKKRSRLAFFMGLSPKSSWILRDRPFAPMQKMEFSIEELVDEAFHSRPELFIRDLDEAKSIDERKIARLKLFPNAQISASLHKDHDRFLLNKSWLQTGLQTSWNLLALPMRYKEYKTSKMKQELSEIETSRVSLGVASQVSLAAMEYFSAWDRHQLFQERARIRRRLFSLEILEKQHGLSHDVETVQMQWEFLFAQLSFLSSYADLHISAERISNSVGRPFHHRSYLNQKSQSDQEGLYHFYDLLDQYFSLEGEPISGGFPGKRFNKGIQNV